MNITAQQLLDFLIKDHSSTDSKYRTYYPPNGQIFEIAGTDIRRIIDRVDLFTNSDEEYIIITGPNFVHEYWLCEDINILHTKYKGILH